MSEQRTTKPNTSVDYFDEEDEEEEEDPYATDDDRDGNYSPPAVQKKKKIVEKNLTSKPVCKPKEKRTQNESKTKKFVATFDEKKKFAGYLEKEQFGISNTNYMPTTMLSRRHGIVYQRK